LIRSVHEAIHIEERAKRAGANLASVTELFDTSTANGWMMWMFTLVIDEGYIRQTSERTKSSMQYLKTNGQTYRQSSLWADNRPEQTGDIPPGHPRLDRPITRT